MFGRLAFDRTVRYGTVLYCTGVLPGSTMFYQVLEGTVPYSTVRYGTVRYSAEKAPGLRGTLRGHFRGHFGGNFRGHFVSHLGLQDFGITY